MAVFSLELARWMFGYLNVGVYLALGSLGIWNFGLDPWILVFQLAFLRNLDFGASWMLVTAIPKLGLGNKPDA